MNTEEDYLAALELTHRMLDAAITQDWDTLTRIGAERGQIIERVSSSKSALLPLERQRIAAIIAEIEREGLEIMERVQTWQDHVRILLMKTPSS